MNFKDSYVVSVSPAIHGIDALINELTKLRRSILVDPPLYLSGDGFNYWSTLRVRLVRINDAPDAKQAVLLDIQR